MSTPAQQDQQPSEDLLIDRRGPALWVTINRPERRNAINPNVFNGILRAYAMTEEDRTIRAVVLTAVGDKAFCAGGDLKPDSKTFEFDHSAPTTPLGNLLRAAYGCDLPIIARINGHCMAGGMGLLTMADMAVASDNALFGLPEVKIGMFPMQVSALLQSLISRRKFAELCLTGEPIGAAEALDIGLVNYVTPIGELDARTDWLIDRLVGKSPTAIRRGKHALRATRNMTIEQAISFMETQLATLALTEDSIEGIAAFNEKRPPRWTGR